MLDQLSREHLVELLQAAILMIPDQFALATVFKATEAYEVDPEFRQAVEDQLLACATCSESEIIDCLNGKVEHVDDRIRYAMARSLNVPIADIPT